MKQSYMVCSPLIEKPQTQAWSPERGALSQDCDPRKYQLAEWEGCGGRFPGLHLPPGNSLPPVAPLREEGIHSLLNREPLACPSAGHFQHLLAELWVTPPPAVCFVSGARKNHKSMPPHTHTHTQVPVEGLDSLVKAISGWS